MRVCASVITVVIGGVRYTTEAQPSSCSYILGDCHTDNVEEGCGMPADMPSSVPAMYDTQYYLEANCTAHRTCFARWRH